VSRASNKARLAVARDDARSRLIERIKKAEEIKADDIRSRDDLAAAEEREKRWREYNSALLSRLFTADEYADEYSAARRSVHVVSDRYIDPSLSDLAGRLVNSINSQISTLRSIIERLELIDEGTAPEPQMETSESRALRLLAAIGDNTKNTDAPVFVAQLAPGLGLSEQEVNDAWQYLADKNLIRTYNLRFTARLNAHGVDVLETAKQSPNQPAPGFGPVTYNTINIHHMEGSSIQQAGSHSTQAQSATYGQQDFDDLKRALDLLEQNFEQLRLDAATAKSARAQIGTLKAQLINEPNPVILKEAGKTLRNVTEGVVGGLITTAVQPGIWQFVQDVLARLFH